MSLVCSFNTNQINRLTRKCFSPVFLGLIRVKSSTLNACPMSELRSAIKWLILLFWTNGIILYKKKVIENLHSKYSTETFTERCSAKTAILKKSVLQYSCSSFVVKIQRWSFIGIVQLVLAQLFYKTPPRSHI